MTDPTPKPWWPPHAIRRHVQEPTPDAGPADPTTWPEDAIAEVARLKDAIEWHMQEATDARVHAEQVEAALAQSEKARRGQQVQIEAQRAKLDAVRALACEFEWVSRANLRAVLRADPAPCPTCSGPIRETVGMVCQTCGTDYAAPEAGGDDE